MRHWSSEVIRQIRTEKKMTQLELSADSGISMSTIRAVEEGRTDVAIAKIDYIFYALGYDLEAIRMDIGDEE
jgi:transcriptional regulator with XRE-family HTH domain|tara:strand:+ start:93 stop:308 length:216 start_codon:yes stop_codon:yes gene_type:complete